MHPRRALCLAILGAVLALPATPASALCPDFGLPEGTEIAELETNMGSICLELLSEEAPITVENFIDYIERGDYDGTFVHRSISGFVVQAGGFTVDADNRLGEVLKQPAIPNEPCELDTTVLAPQGEVPACSQRGNERGTLAMAKDPRDPDSATSQWFINLADNRGGLAQLDTQNEGFTVFARVLGDGMTLVGDIEDLPLATPERMYWLDPSFVRARPGLFDVTPVQALPPLLPGTLDFGCFDPTRLAAVVEPDPESELFAPVTDPITQDRFFFVGADCATPIEPGTFQPQPGPDETCPDDSQLALAVDAPMNPSTEGNPQGVPLRTDFDDGELDELDLSCPQKAESLERRGEWRADFTARLASELVVVERASVIQVPEPRAEALAAAALAVLLVLRRVRTRPSRGG